MLEEKKKELTKVQAVEKSEKQAIEQMKGNKAKLEADLQKATKDFESKQLSFMRDLVALKGKIDTISNNPTKLMAEAGRAS